MSDRLRDEFEAFRVDSLARTRPPGVPAIRRTLGRRAAVRAVVLAAAAVIAIVLTFTWQTPDQGRAPIHPPIPSIPPSPVPTPSASASVPPSPGVPSSSPPNTLCTSWPNRPVSTLLTSAGPDGFTIADSLVKACPGVTLHITRAVYVGNGASASRLTLYGSIMHPVSARSRSTQMPTIGLPSGSCFTSLTLTMITSSPPHTITNLVPEIESSGDDDAMTRYLAGRGIALIRTAWSQPSC
jgi:hypothetical protein